MRNFLQYHHSNRLTSISHYLERLRLCIEILRHLPQNLSSITLSTQFNSNYELSNALGNEWTSTLKILVYFSSRDTDDSEVLRLFCQKLVKLDRLVYICESAE
jgi:hypothetical protein